MVSTRDMRCHFLLAPMGRNTVFSAKKEKSHTCCGSVRASPGKRRLLCSCIHFSRRNRRASVGQTLSAACSSSGEHLATVGSRHSFAEAVLHLAMTLFGLIGTEHVSIPLSVLCRPFADRSHQHAFRHMLSILHYSVFYFFCQVLFRDFPRIFLFFASKLFSNVFSDILSGILNVPYIT